MENARFLRYVEDVSKNRQGGLKYLKVAPKVVIQHENVTCPERCHVSIFKKYIELSPKDRRDDCFYLTPLQRPMEKMWYSRQPVRVNQLGKHTVDMCKEAVYKGFSQTILGERLPRPDCMKAVSTSN